MKGLILSVFRDAALGDCTNGGLSAKVDRITVVNLGPGSEVFEATDKVPAFLLEMHVRGCLRLVPVDPKTGKKKVGPMFGGNYASTSDSRFSEACRRLLGHEFYGAVAIHDRFETPEEYEALMSKAKRGTVREVPGPSNSYLYKVETTTGDIHWVTSSNPLGIGDRVLLRYMATSTRGYYSVTKEA